MSGDTVVELMQLFDQSGIEVFVDGGWGVEALLGEQTRSHLDLDIALEHKHVPKLRALLEARGYRDVPRDDTRDCNFVMGDEQGHEVDVHSICTYSSVTPANTRSGYEFPHLEEKLVKYMRINDLSGAWLVDPSLRPSHERGVPDLIAGPASRAPRSVRWGPPRADSLVRSE